MYSFGIKIAKEVNRAGEEVNTIPKLGLISDIAEVLIFVPEPIKISVIINKNFFLFFGCYFF